MNEKRLDLNHWQAFHCKMFLFIPSINFKLWFSILSGRVRHPEERCKGFPFILNHLSPGASHNTGHLTFISHVICIPLLPPFQCRPRLSSPLHLLHALISPSLSLFTSLSVVLASLPAHLVWTRGSAPGSLLPLWSYCLWRETGTRQIWVSISQRSG